MMRRPPAARPALTLMEVLVSLAIFLLSLAALARLVTFAGERAVEAQFRSQATLHCLSQLAEVEAGSIALGSQGETALDDDPDYNWSMDAQQGQAAGLWNVTVRVSRKAPGGTSVTVSLSKMVLDPSVVGSTQDSVPVSSSQNNNSSSSGSGTGSSSTGSSSSGM
jgi:type II secretory pathway pseudopilin PulG